MKSFKFLIVAAVVVLSLSLLSEQSKADGGMIPFHDFSVYEPGQKAIIGWNGEEEIMILSVDVYSSKDTKALHLVPFPSEPEVWQGNVSSFEKIEEIINEGRYSYGDGEDNGKEGRLGGNGSQIEIVFHDKIGAHDISILKVKDSTHFKEWVENYLKENGVQDVVFPPNTNNVIEYYLKKEMSFFAFDVIEISKNESSVEPLVYKFKTDRLIFPLKISSIIKGESQISLALITPDNLPLDIRPLKNLGFFGNRYYDDYISKLISKKEIREVDENLSDLFKGNGQLTFVSQRFNLSKLSKDLELGARKDVKNFLTFREEFNIHKVDVNQDGIFDLILTFDNSFKILDG